MNEVFIVYTNTLITLESPLLHLTKIVKHTLTKVVRE